MKAFIAKSKIKGKMSAPPSKSYTIRGLMCAALARGESEIAHFLSSEDTEAAANVLSKVGVRVRPAVGRWRVNGGNFHQPREDLFCGDSAATLRFMTAVCSIIPGKCRLTVGPSLARRPVGPLVQVLRQLGVDCYSQGGVAPVVVNGGWLKGGVIELPGDISSQFISALLFMAPFAEEGVKIRLTTPLESKPYVLMTLDCLKNFEVKVEYTLALDEFEITRQSYRSTRYEVEGDWSSASYFLALGAVAGDVAVENLNLESFQGDKMMLNFLREMGALVEINHDSVVVRKSRLKAIKADLTDGIDLLPTMAVLAAAAMGTSEFTGIARARLKESDRVAAVGEGLQRMGVVVTEEKDKLVIVGSGLTGAVIDSHYDHRIAMAFSILGILAGGTTINGAECVNKTFPEFWAILESIEGKVMIDE
ncbi:MAG: 3-phosphoshikimate 1-carboxyvinyltransferase [Dehalococcoidales bacterium]|nr:3-phosphoshikimate 1-carboxyvinyltransferase [Dehalococcoidales bacterium]MDP6448854.1 3-phosphoshikimate 1-carboxyvinyltransferase [Dehalococcoidales bacterium]MDP6576218.1 3-phosphoshikimate 1-carboxyvinyltransferase [Dehalococcoidales bacterium]MDP6825405.1 3-phosphoshikimate 1-carboxyvinyltransferase [Dehalococcoidales bacterium]